MTFGTLQDFCLNCWTLWNLRNKVIYFIPFFTNISEQTSGPQPRLFNIYCVKRRCQSKHSVHQSCPSSISLGFDNIINQTNNLNCTYITLYNYTMHCTIRTRDNKVIQEFYFGLQQLKSPLVQAWTKQIREQTTFNSYKHNKETVYI